ncbi:DEAD/DEAH box helicase [Clostridium gasigenes]|uniref:DEAD/DEAH box helicase n=1 Tax=Clostridium gasigenes TaxID=94869 RepID=UPI001626EC7C|nr:DEAD/DEAH box helicase [Clostridium gasigenes]MBB6622868.1 DEAD/DEAH box helicase [Clostridium gasigenes]
MENKGFSELKLSDDIVKALENLGYKKPSEVQIEAIPHILNREDIIVKSQTGSGKTASFGIPLCEMVEVEESRVQGLILVPTRELALQVKEDISNIGRLKKVRAAAVFGKQPFHEQVRELKQRVHIVSGTPGRISDHIRKGNLKLDDIKFVIIDEADKMLSMGFIDQIKEILEVMPKDRTTALFSATLPEIIEKLCGKYMRNPKILNVQSEVFNRDKIKESFLELEYDEKANALTRNLYANTPDAAIVFCNTKDKVRELHDKLKKDGVMVEQLHGDMEQKDRLSTMERFKNKEFKVLIATDIASRGIHVDNITHVFNYELPGETENYVHRIGRTGRAGREGCAISFVSKFEKRFLSSVESYVGYEIKEGKHPSDEEVKVGKIIFKESQKAFGLNKGVKKVAIHTDVTKIHLTGGKKKKLRAIDVVGALSNLKELTGEDIGIIDIQDTCSFVDILNGKGSAVVKNNKEITIKGKSIRIQKANK